MDAGAGAREGCVASDDSDVQLVWLLQPTSGGVTKTAAAVGIVPARPCGIVCAVTVMGRLHGRGGEPCGELLLIEPLAQLAAPSISAGDA